METFFANLVEFAQGLNEEEKRGIAKNLTEVLRNYVPELYQQKCDVVYQHIFDSYFGQGQSIYR